MRSSERSTAGRARCRAMAWGVVLLTAGLASGRAHAEPACAPDRSASEAALELLRARNDALDRKEQRLQERERTQVAAGREAERRLQELEALRGAVDARLARLETATDERTKDLADLYGRMLPERAAAVLQALDPDLAARILARVRRPRAAEILNALPDARAADLSRRLLRPGHAPVPPAPIAQVEAVPAPAGSSAASVP